MQFYENAEMIEVGENEETVDIKEELDDIDKKFVETKGASKNKPKASQLMTSRMNAIQLRILWRLRLRLKLMNLLRSMLNK